MLHVFIQKADTPLKRIGLSLLILALAVFAIDFLVWLIAVGPKGYRWNGTLFDLFKVRSSRYYAEIAYISIGGIVAGLALFKGWIDTFLAWVKTGHSNRP